MHPSRPPSAFFFAPFALAFAVGCGGSSKPAVVPGTPTTVSSSAPSASHVGPSEFTAPPVRPTASTRATLKLNSTWSHCHEAFSVGSADVKAEVARLSQGCAEVTKMHRAFEPFTGQQSAADKPQTFAWKGQAGHCYRAYGVGVAAIKNLDLLLKDSAGVSLAQDGADDNAPVVLDAGAVCFKADDEGALVVSVGDGSGAFAVELWMD